MTEETSKILIDAQNGNVSAYYNLGLIYQYGLYGEEINYLLSHKYYKIAADSNHAKALNNLGYLYENGLGVKKDKYQAKRYYKQSGELGNLTGRCNYLEHCTYGYSYSDVKEIEPEFQKLADKGFVRARYKLAIKDLKNLELKEQALQVLKECAEQDYLPAKVELFNYYKNLPFGGEKEAVYYARQLVKANHSEAMCFVGESYYYGNYVDKDYNNALLHFKKGVALNNGRCAYWIGKMYYEGVGVPIDKKKAFRYFKTGTDLADTYSANYLGYMYECGEEVKQDKFTALKLFKFAADNGYSVAYCNVGMYYEGGIGTDINFKKAHYYYSLGLQANEPRAYYCMGKMYHYGKFVKQDTKTALEYYINAFNKGYKTPIALEQ